MSIAGTHPPSLDDIQALARAALATIPEELRRFARDVVVGVAEFPDDDLLDELGLDSPFDLLGVYKGVALNHKSVLDAPHDLDMVMLFRRPILDYWCETDEDLEAIVRHVLIHEIGHHFGFSDADMARIEAHG